MIGKFLRKSIKLACATSLNAFEGNKKEMEENMHAIGVHIKWLCLHIRDEIKIEPSYMTALYILIRFSSHPVTHIKL